MEMQSTTRQTVAATPSFSGLCQRCEGQSTSSFSFFQQPQTDLPFCHSQPCHVHLFHLNLVKYRHMAGFVWWRACGEELFFFFLCFVHMQDEVKIDALDDVEFYRNMSRIERHELYLRMVSCSCMYS